MSLSITTIKATKRKKVKRLGRGNASQKGTYAGRGMKGQRSRSGGKGGTQRRGFKQSLQKVPKLRGFNSPHAKKETVTLATLNRAFADGDSVSPRILRNKGIVDHPSFGVKIVASGKLEKKLTVKGCLVSKRAMEAIEKAGGTITF